MEFDEFVSAFAHEQLPDGQRRVVRNGHLPERQVLTGIGAVDVQVPKARSCSGAPEPFQRLIAYSDLVAEVRSLDLEPQDDRLAHLLG